MAEPGDPDWDESVHAFQQDLAVDLADVAAARRTIHLMWPSLEHAGGSAAGSDIAKVSHRIAR